MCFKTQTEEGISASRTLLHCVPNYHMPRWRWDDDWAEIPSERLLLAASTLSPRWSSAMPSTSPNPERSWPMGPVQQSIPNVPDGTKTNLMMLLATLLQTQARVATRGNTSVLPRSCTLAEDCDHTRTRRRDFMFIFRQWHRCYYCVARYSILGYMRSLTYTRYTRYTRFVNAILLLVMSKMVVAID